MAVQRVPEFSDKLPESVIGLPITCNPIQAMLLRIDGCHLSFHNPFPNSHHDSDPNSAEEFI